VIEIDAVMVCAPSDVSEAKHREGLDAMLCADDRWLSSFHFLTTPREMLTWDPSSVREWIHARDTV
jgi:hypothetical protein